MSAKRLSFQLYSIHVQHCKRKIVLTFKSFVKITFASVICIVHYTLNHNTITVERLYFTVFSHLILTCRHSIVVAYWKQKPAIYPTYNRPLCKTGAWYRIFPNLLIASEKWNSNMFKNNFLMAIKTSKCLRLTITSNLPSNRYIFVVHRLIFHSFSGITTITTTQ